MDKELAVPVDTRHPYVGLPLDTPLIDVECTCKGEEVAGCKSILPVSDNTPKVIVYNSCKRTLFASMKRQLRRTPLPHPDVVPLLHQFMDEYFSKYVEPHLRDFDYSYSEWYNSMPVHKQDAIDRVDTRNYANLVKNEYGLFCKREKQEMGGKNRAISNISQESKYVMGPVVWALESIAAEHFPGYCGPLNWQQQEEFYNSCFDQGYQYVVQGDGSAFDLSQANDCKYIDRLIYNYLADNGKIHHVPSEVFKTVATATHRTLKATYVVNGRIKTLGKARVEGTVFSGSSDTTFGNTLRMAIYNMFTMHMAGLKYKEDYVLKSKGDDFFVLSRVNLDWNKAYYKYWIPAIKDPNNYAYEPKGIGQILKFLVVGDYSSLDFCSTTVCPYICPDTRKQKFKILRKPDRLNHLSHYSRQALSMSNAELKQYYLDLALSFESYAKGLPLYQNYADAYRFYASKIQGASKPYKQGKPSRKKEHDGHRLTHSNDPLLKLKNSGYNHDFKQALVTRVSSSAVPHEYVYRHLLYRYNITRLDIQCHSLRLLQQSPYDHLSGAMQ